MGAQKQAPVATANPQEFLGERYTESAFERAFYHRDLASVPRLLERLLGKTVPDGVARPGNTQEVAALVSYAANRRLAVTPRAAATTVYWNAVPVRGGLLIDMTGLSGLLELDEARGVATVLPGTRWDQLDALLRRRGFTLRTCPTSAPSATVGGWVSMEGHGIGSLKYGGLEEQVLGLEVVLPDGQVVKLAADSQPPLAWFLGAEGTLGILTRVELAVRRLPEQVSRHLLAFPDLETLQGAALQLSKGDPRPYHVHFSTVEHHQMLQRAGFLPPEGFSTYGDRPTLHVSFEGGPAEVEAGAAELRACAASWKAVLLPNEWAEQEWQERFYDLRMKRSGPTLLGAETWLALDRLTSYEAHLARLAGQQRLPIATYGNVVAPGVANVLSFYPTDESRPLAYVLALSLTNRIFHIAFRLGGRPYGIGFWNSPYLRYAGSAAELAERRRRKRLLDPVNIMNPGKLYAPPAILPPPLFDFGMGTLAWLRSLAKGAE